MKSKNSIHDTTKLKAQIDSNIDKDFLKKKKKVVRFKQKRLKLKHNIEGMGDINVPI